MFIYDILHCNSDSTADNTDSTEDQTMDKNLTISADELKTSTAKKTLARHGKPNYRGQLTIEFTDKQIKGLKLSLVSSSQAPDNIHVKLYSIAETKGKKHRYTWYDNTSVPTPPTPQELAQIKANAQAWHTNKINNSNYNIFKLSNYTDSFITSYSKPNTQATYKKSLNKFDKFTTEPLEKLNHVEICNHIQKTYPVNCSFYISNFCTFLSYVWKKTDSELVFNLINKIRLIAPKKTKSSNHFKTIESVNNKELTEKLIRGFTQLILHTKQKTVQQAITRFLFPLRYSELKNITPADILEDRIIIKETKTTQNFLVPLSHLKAREQLTQHPITLGIDQMNKVLKKYFNLTTHSTRSIFDTYFSRIEKHQSNYIEACLSHKERSAVILAYRTDARNYYFEKRIPIMNEWYDFIFDIVRQAQERAKGENIQKINA